MCRIGAIKSRTPVHPSLALNLMQSQQKGHDNSGFAMVMQDLEGVFREYKDVPLMSYACDDRGVKIVEEYMSSQGWTLDHHWSPKKCDPAGLDIALMKHYHFENFGYPRYVRSESRTVKEAILTEIRLKLRALLESEDSGFIYSFWPDVLTLKEIGNPRDIGTYFNLWDADAVLVARNITVQCRQNTNYEIVRYAAHPFFCQGYTALANGENTFYVKNKECQQNLNPAYIGFESDSQCFLYTLHYLHRQLGWPIDYYKHVITPLPLDEMNAREDREVLTALRQSLPHLEINGPNTIIAVLPDGTMINVCDSKKLRPVVIGRTEHMVVISSEVCGLNDILPSRNQEKDIYPHERETIVITNELEVKRCRQ